MDERQVDTIGNVDITFYDVTDISAADSYVIRAFSPAGVSVDWTAAQYGLNAVRYARAKTDISEAGIWYFQGLAYSAGVVRWWTARIPVRFHPNLPEPA